MTSNTPISVSVYSKGDFAETENLLLSPPSLSDIPSLYGFLGDSHAMKLTHSDKSFAECRKRVLIHEWFRRRDGFAPWTIREKSDQRIIGWGGIYKDPFDPGWGPEVGYYFDPKVWGRGFGSEFVMEAVTLASQKYGLMKLTAFAHPDNIASRRLLEKAGFQECDFIEQMNRYRFDRVF